MAKEQGRKLIASNRKARHDYHVEDTWEAGLVLMGTEVKSLRQGRATLVDGFAEVDGHEVWLHGVHIPEYTQGTWTNHSARRRRKLLLNRSEIDKIERKIGDKGYTLVPLALYFKDGRAKVEIALARGKKTYDKRHALAERQAEPREGASRRTPAEGAHRLMPIEVVRRHDPEAVREILASLPEWFGIPEANTSYVEDAGRVPSYLAVDGDEVVGRRAPQRALPAVARAAPDRRTPRPASARASVGCCSTAIESDLRESGVRILEVHTVGPSSESGEYARTREFYLRHGLRRDERAPADRLERPDPDPGQTPVTLDPVLEREGSRATSACRGCSTSHTHFLPPRVMAKVRHQFDTAGPLIGQRLAAGVPRADEELVATLRGFGVRRFSALPYAHKPEMAEFLNDWSFRFADRTPGCLRSATFYPEPGAAAYVAQRIGAGAEIFKVHVQVGGFDVRDPLLDDVWGVLEDARAPGRRPRRLRPGRHARTPGRDRSPSCCAAHPRLALVIAHLGAPEYAEFLGLAEAYEHVRRRHDDGVHAVLRPARRRVPAPTWCRGCATCSRRSCSARTSRTSPIRTPSSSPVWPASTWATTGSVTSAGATAYACSGNRNRRPRVEPLRWTHNSTGG